MDRQTPITGVGVPQGCPLGQDPLPVYKSLLWKIKKQLALTHPIYYQVVAAGELNKRQGGELSPSCQGHPGHGRTPAGDGGWWQPTPGLCSPHTGGI